MLSSIWKLANANKILIKHTLICSYLRILKSLAISTQFYEPVALITLAIICRPMIAALIVEVEWLDDGIEGRRLYSWGLLAVNVAGQFIHLNHISLCYQFGVSAHSPGYHHAVTWIKEGI